MAKRCSLTGKSPLTGNRVSHANNHTKRRQLPNLKKRRLYLPDEDRWIQVRVSTKALKSLDKKGLKSILKKKGMTLDQLG